MAELIGALPARAVEILASLAQHRVLSTPQVHAIHSPKASLRWAQKLLGRLRRAGLADYVESARGRRRLWHATDRGAQLAHDAGALEGGKRTFGAEVASGPLAAHTLAVNDAAICFCLAASERGDDFGPLDWRHEVAHPLSRGRGRRRQALIADAVFTYLHLDGKGIAIEQRFLELDRATLSVDRLAAELARYAQLHRARDGKRGEPLWRSHYPVFPPVHCVLTGAPRRALSRRRSTASVLLASDPLFSRTPEVAISVCLLEDLQREGPFAPVFRDVRDPGRPVDWLGRPSERKEVRE
jgi:protein involved in plasmid replication-relaxation